MKKFTGILYIIIASVAYGLMPIFVKDALNNGLNTNTIIVLRFSISALFLWIYLISQKISIRISKKLFLHIMALSIVGYCTTSLLLFLSYNYISVGLATMLHFVYPMIVTLLMVTIYKEKLYPVTVISISLSFIGIYFLIDNKDVSLNTYGILLAMLSGVSYAIYIVGISHSEIKKLNSYVLTFYVTGISALPFLINGLFTNSINLKMAPNVILDVSAVALISTVFALITFIKGLNIIGPSNAAIINTLEPIVSVIFGVIIFHEVLHLSMIIGCLLVVSSVVLLSVMEMRKNHIKSSYVKID